MDPLPPDPYAALGVSRTADAATIKSTYRKLALKCHPDKVTDPSLKKQKEEEFHRIQQAYEIIGDEDKRKSYEAELRLDQLRKEKLARGGNSNPDIRTAHYEVRTAAPAGATFSARGPTRYEERRPAATTSRTYDDDRYYEDRSSSRKYPTYDAQPKHTSTARTSRPRDETPIKVTRVSADRTRADTKKTRDREVRNDRSGSGRFVHVSDESSSDEKAREKARYEANYKRLSEDARTKAHKEAEAEDARRQAAKLREKTDGGRRSYEEVRRHRSDERDLHDRQRKLSEQELEAKNYIGRAREAETRPSPSRQGSSSRDVRAETSYFDSRSSRRDRDRDLRVPVDPRRSSAARKDRPSSSGRDRDRKGLEIVDWETERTPPSFKHSSSSPADLHVPRAMPQRSQTESSRDHRRTDSSPPAGFRRAETMPSPTEPRRKETTYPRPSGLRRSETATKHEPIPEPLYATIPVPGSSSSKKTYYHYPTPGGGVSLHPDDVGVANGHRTILREPDRHRTRSPSPLGRPPIGANRPVEAFSPIPQAAPRPATLGRAATMNVNAEAERGRSRPLYGEIGPDRRENVRARQTSFSPEKVIYAPKIGREDVSYSRRDSERDYNKPSLGRTATYVY